MADLRQLESRVLAIDPTSRGFGFAVLEGPRRLIDWGLFQSRIRKNHSCLGQIRKLIDHYRPNLLVVEDLRKNSRRCSRVRKLLQTVQNLASKSRVKCRAVSLVRVRQVFSDGRAMTKYQIAEVVAQRFPELAPRLPPPRKPWHSEAEAMAIFDSVALVLGYSGVEK